MFMITNYTTQYDLLNIYINPYNGVIWGNLDTLYGLQVSFYKPGEKTKKPPFGFETSVPVDPVLIRFNGDQTISSYIFPDVYFTVPQTITEIGKLPSFMSYKEKQIQTGNGISFIREI
jgi:hypothetical protein